MLLPLPLCLDIIILRENFIREKGGVKTAPWKICESGRAHWVNLYPQQIHVSSYSLGEIDGGFNFYIAIQFSRRAGTKL